MIDGSRRKWGHLSEQFLFSEKPSLFFSRAGGVISVGSARRKTLFPPLFPNRCDFFPPPRLRPMDLDPVFHWGSPFGAVSLFFTAKVKIFPDSIRAPVWLSRSVIDFPPPLSPQSPVWKFFFSRCRRNHFFLPQKVQVRIFYLREGPFSRGRIKLPFPSLDDKGVPKA